MKKSTYHITIRTQILLITFSFTLLIGVVISTASYFVYRNYLEDNLIQSTDTNLLFLRDYIDNELNNINQLVRYCQNNTTIGLFVESETASSKKRNEAYEVLQEYCQNNASSSYLHRVVITNLSESYIQIIAPAYSSTIDIAEALPQQDFYETLTASGYTDYNIGFIDDVFYPRNSKSIIPLLKPITYKFNSNLGGYIFIEISDTLFADAMSNTYQENGGDLFLTLGDQTYLFENGCFSPITDEYTYTASATRLKGRESAIINHVKKSSGEEFVLITEPLATDGCYVSQLLTPKQMNSQLPVFWSLIAILLFILILIGFFINHLLNRTINVPVRRIQKRLIDISNGNFSRDTSIEWNHELGDIGKGVNYLADNVKQLIQTTLDDEKKKRDLEYKVLQSQVNPHFLYNTLNSIKWMATIQGATGITEMTTALSRLLKSISKGTKLLIPLREELSLVQDYFTIQQYRYGGTIQMNIEVDNEALYDCLINKFTLQPLVENAIFHGIEPTGVSGTITIHVSASDNNLKIDVTDTGVGMTKEQIEKVLSDESESSSDFFRDLGVINVQKRIQYEFGSSYGLSIESELGVYTTMSILLPQRKELS